MVSILKDPNNSGKILDMISDTLILMDKNGVCVDIIIHNEELWFLKKEILLGKNLLTMLPPETYDELYPEFRKVLSQKVKSTRNYELTVRNETYFIKCIMQPYDDMVLCQYRDITDIRQRNNDINLLTHAINNSTEDIFAAREDGTMIFANRRYMQHHNLNDTEDITQLKIYEIQSYAQSKEEWQRIATAVKRGEREKAFTMYNPLPLYPDILAYESNAYWIISDEGIGTVWAFGRDVSQRILHEQQIKRFNQILDKTLEHLPAGIVVKDVKNNFKYLYRNRESYNHDVPMPDALGKDDFDFYPLEIAQEKRRQDIQIASTGQEMHWITEERDSQGNPIFFDKRKMRIESKDFSPILLNIEWDITDMELMKRELMIAKEKAETSDQLKSAFLANMSHEIRTPLNAIVGFSRIIAESEDPEERKNYYDIVETNNERLLQLINEILDLSKIEAGSVKFSVATVSLHSLCKEIYDAYIFHCPTGVELIFEPSDEELCINSDKNRIFQVISNLIGNAFKFTTKGSISYGYRLEGENIVFHVVDTGTGIAPENVGKIFERFVKANNFAQGTGLGLAICQTIINRLGGTISVSSELGKGTTFTFTLPVNAAKEEEKDMLKNTPESHEPAIEEQSTITGSPEKAPEPPSKDNSMKTILIAEDTESNYILLKAILKKEYHLEHAKDGIEAVNMFTEIQPDIILMDIKMPNLDGLEATKIIRELSPNIPIVALTAFAYDQDQKAALNAGCNDFLTKPFTQEALKETIKKWIK